MARAAERACSTRRRRSASAEFEARYRVGGFFLHSAYNDLFTDAEANELHLRLRPRQDPRAGAPTPTLAEQLCPYEYPLATKRMCIDTGYYEAFNRPNVRLVNLQRDADRGDHRPPASASAAS